MSDEIYRECKELEQRFLKKEINLKKLIYELAKIELRFVEEYRRQDYPPMPRKLKLYRELRDDKERERLKSEIHNDPDVQKYFALEQKIYNFNTYFAPRRLRELRRVFIQNGDSVNATIVRMELEGYQREEEYMDALAQQAKETFGAEEV